MLNKKDFDAKIQYLTDQDPDHPVLIKTGGKHNYFNAFLLDKAIKAIPPPPDENPEQKQSDDERPPQLKMMYAQVRNLITKKAKLSNQFHDCRNDAERARVSDAILELQRSIGKIMDNIDFYKEHQELPAVPDPEKYPLPSDPIELYKKKENLVSTISRKKKAISTWAAKGNQEKVDEHSTKLRKYQIHLTYVRKAIACLPIQ